MKQQTINFYWINLSLSFRLPEERRLKQNWLVPQNWYSPSQSLLRANNCQNQTFTTCTTVENPGALNCLASREQREGLCLRIIFPDSPAVSHNLPLDTLTESGAVFKVTQNTKMWRRLPVTLGRCLTLFRTCWPYIDLLVNKNLDI